MIVSVIAVDMVQATVMDEIHVRAMLHHHMLFTIMAVHMIIGGNDLRKLMRARMGCTDRQSVFVDMPFVRAVKMAVVQKVDMTVMLKHGMAAIDGMLMPGVIGMDHFMRKGSGRKHGNGGGS
jgi:hypothetical protein